MDEREADAVAPEGGTTAHASVERISHYRIVALLGKGGMGEVYAAEDEVLRRRVALKSIRSESRLDPDLRARFLREARVLSQLDHPNICRIYDYVAASEGDYIVLELLEGANLAEWIASGGSKARALSIALEIAQALAAAHAAGVVHRDIKPGNVMVTSEGTTKVLDFGLSRLHDPAREPVASAHTARPLGAPIVGGGGTLIWEIAAGTVANTPGGSADDVSLQTRVGGLLGTVRYMSPEQARGELVTAASDMYSFGLLLQELFTGAPATERSADPAEDLRRAQLGQTAPTRGLDRELTALITQLKAPQPANRPVAADVVRRLRSIQERPQRRLRRAFVAGVLIAALLGAIKYTFDLRRERARAEGRTAAALEMMQTLFEEQVPVLAEVGRLDAFNATAVGLQAYFASVPRAELTDRELVKLSKLLQLVGTVRESQGRPAEAQSHFREALAVVSELAERHPEDSEILLSLGAAHFYLGQIALRALHDPAAALVSFQAYRDAAVRNELVDPDRVNAARELSYAQNAIAATLLELGRVTEALEEQQRIVDRLREQVAAAPAQSDLVVDLADNLSWLGSARLEAGERSTARAVFEEELGVRRAARDKDPRNAAARASLAYCLTFLARIHLGESQADASVECATEARDLLIELFAHDPDNAERGRTLQAARQSRVDALRSAGRTDEARAECAASLELCETLLAMEPENPVLRQGRIGMLLDLAELEPASPDTTDERRARAQRVQELVAREPDAPAAERERWLERLARVIDEL